MSTSPHAENIRKAERAIEILQSDMKKVAETATDLMVQSQFATKDIERCNNRDEKLATGLKELGDTISGMVARLVQIEQEIGQLKNWNAEQKKERDEKARRFWAFGPNITAAIITIILAPLSVLLWKYLSSLITGQNTP